MPKKLITRNFRKKLILKEKRVKFYLLNAETAVNFGDLENEFTVLGLQGVRLANGDRRSRATAISTRLASLEGKLDLVVDARQHLQPIQMEIQVLLLVADSGPRKQLLVLFAYLKGHRSRVTGRKDTHRVQEGRLISVQAEAHNEWIGRESE